MYVLFIVVCMANECEMVLIIFYSKISERASENPTKLVIFLCRILVYCALHGCIFNIYINLIIIVAIVIQAVLLFVFVLFLFCHIHRFILLLINSAVFNSLIAKDAGVMTFTI